MKNILSIFMLFAIVLAGCEKDITTEDKSVITNYVTFSFDDTNAKDQFGNYSVVIPKGASYDVSKNFTAMEGDADVSTAANIEGAVDANAAGYYPVSYAAVNADGYSAGVDKAIIVSDASITGDISGDYSATVFRTPTGNAYTDGYDASIEKVADGVFYFTRMLGSYYYDGFGYSAFGSYFVHGFVVLNSDNTLSITSNSATFCPGWNDTLSGFKDGVYDPATGKIEFTSLYAGGREFHVTYMPK